MIFENCLWSIEMANSGIEVAEKKVEWTHEETVLLLNLYESSLENIGPSKQFKNKKQMWIFIGTELAKAGIDRTGMQCENRYKTVYKRKRKNNELSSIIETANRNNNNNNNLQSASCATDDDTENPRIQISHCYTDTTYVNENTQDSSSSSSVEGPPSPAPKSSSQTRKRKKRDWEKEMCDVLRALAKERERNKQARHEEKMELLRAIFKLE